MADPFIAQVTLFPYTFAPRGWAMCSGQLMSIAQNTALYSLIGTTYGGDGRSSMGLPNLLARSPYGAGTAPGLSPAGLGELWGAESVSLDASHIPAHNHDLYMEKEGSEVSNPTNTALGALKTGSFQKIYKKSPYTLSDSMAPGALAVSGESQPHENRQPLLAMRFCIALEGVYPSRN
ncbi:MAG: phage tail protein [Gammaproteobacteria bacterium]